MKAARYLIKVDKRLKAEELAPLTDVGLTPYLGIKKLRASFGWRALFVGPAVIKFLSPVTTTATAVKKRKTWPLCRFADTVRASALGQGHSGTLSSQDGSL